MPAGKIRHPNHMIDERALQFLYNQFPIEWVQREITPDYGLDIDLELFDYQDKECITLGEHVFLQVKGTENPKYNKINLFGCKNNPDRITVIKYNLEVSELNLVEHMGSAIPVLLIIVDLTIKKAYHLCLNDYIKKVLPLQNPNYQMQKSITIYIPVDNVFSSDALDVIRWYGKRAKLYSLFNEMISDIDDCNYMCNEDLVVHIRKFIDTYIEYDVWNVRSIWPILDDLYLLMIEMKTHDMINEKDKLLIQHISGTGDDWEKKLICLDGNDMEIPAYLCAQIVSIKTLLSRIILTNGMFESYARTWFMPIP